MMSSRPYPFCLSVLVLLLAGPGVAQNGIGINCGSNEVIEGGDGIEYEAEMPWQIGQRHGYVGGSPRRFKSLPLLHHDGPWEDRAIYARFRQGEQRHFLDIPRTGTYELTIRLFEPYADGPELSLQTIRINGEPLAPEFERFDVYAEVGKLETLDIRRALTLEAGVNELRFSPLPNQRQECVPCVGGIAMRWLPGNPDLLAAVRNPGIEPTFGGAYLTWQAPVLHSVDGYYVTATGASQLTVFAARTYNTWLHVPAGNQLSYQLRAVDAMDRWGTIVELQGVEALIEEESPLPVYHLNIAEADLRVMEAALLNDEKPQVPGALSVDQELRTGLVKRRGSGWLRVPKPSWKFNIQEGPPVRNGDKVNFDSEFIDGTLVRELLSVAIMEGVGLRHYEIEPMVLVLNEVFAGVLHRIEEPDGIFLERVGLDPHGRAYKIECGHFPADDNAENIICFENANQEDWERDDIVALLYDLAKVDVADAESWFEENFDVYNVMDWYASMVYLADSDFHIHNHIFYRARSGGPWSVLPWDVDGPLMLWDKSAVYCSYLDPEQQWTNPLADLIVSVPSLLRRYLLRLEELVNTSLELGVAQDLLQSLVDQVAPFARIDPQKMTRDDNKAYRYEVTLLADNLDARFARLVESIAELMPPAWVDLSLNELILDESNQPTQVELYFRGEEALLLNEYYLSDNRDQLLKWPIPETTLDSDELLLLDLPPGAADATWIGLAIDGEESATLVDSINVIQLACAAGEAIGRFPDGAGRMRVLTGPTPLAPNTWSVPLSLVASTDRSIVHWNEAFQLDLELQGLWRDEIVARIHVRALGEGGVRLDIPPLIVEDGPPLGVGESWETVYPLRVPRQSNRVPAGRYDLEITVTEASSGILLTDHVTLYLDGGSANGELVINELCAKNLNVLQDEAGEYEDWVEILCTANEPVQLDAYGLTDNYAQEPFKWRFPTQWIAPGEKVLVWLDNDLEQGPWHAGFRLAQKGEELALVASRLAGLSEDPWRLVDRIVFGYQDEDWSLGRYPDAGPAWETFATPSPLEPNHDPVLRYY